MTTIRVLVVDDAAAVRRIVQIALGRNARFEVVGTAANGQEAIAAAEKLRPDAIVLDVEMPVMTGLEAIPELCRCVPDAKILMLSAYTSQGASITMQALMAGAADYLHKPSMTGGLDDAVAQLAGQLAEKLEALCPKPASDRSPPTSTATGTDSATGRCEVLAIGSSVGGPVALSILLSGLRSNFPLPILVCQHMPPEFTAQLADILTEKTPFSFSEAQHGQLVQPGRGYVAPGDWHMRVRRRDDETVVIQLNQNPPLNSCRPSVDELYESVADVYGAGTLALVLTGMGRDGLEGCRVIHAQGGRIWVQDEATSTVWGMAGSISRAGLAQRVIPLPDMASAVNQVIRIGTQA